MNSNADFYSGSKIMNDSCCQQRSNERLMIGGVQAGSIAQQGYYSTDSSFQEEDRYSTSFRSMNEPRHNKGEFNNKSLKSSSALQYVDIDTTRDDRKVLPYKYRHMRFSNSSCMDDEEEDRIMPKEKRPCTYDDILPIIAPPAVLSTLKSSTIQQQVVVVVEEPSFHRNLLEVGNDYIPMSGVDETTYAHKMGRTIDTSCAECRTVMFSVETASMVICPYCRYISPMEQQYNGKMKLPTTIIHAGIGLPIDFVIALE